ncbi:MAG: hypothetical protein AABY95_04995 [Pseudomonadota bacterium]
MKKLSTKQRREIAALRKQTARRIDTSDIPEIKDWSKAVRGRFYRPGLSLRLPIYLEPEVQRVLAKHAVQRDMDTGALVNELLKKEIRHLKAA